jgi:hypothetical protein
LEEEVLLGVREGRSLIGRDPDGDAGEGDSGSVSELEELELGLEEVLEVELGGRLEGRAGED